MENINNFDLLEWATSALDFWMKLAELYDTDGVPIDLIYLKLEAENQLPVVYYHLPSDKSENMAQRPVTRDEFEKGIEFCVSLRQSGGLDRLIEKMERGSV